MESGRTVPQRHREAAVAAVAVQKQHQGLIPWIASGFALLAVAMTAYSREAFNRI